MSLATTSSTTCQTTREYRRRSGRRRADRHAITGRRASPRPQHPTPSSALQSITALIQISFWVRLPAPSLVDCGTPWCHKTVADVSLSMPCHHRRLIVHGVYCIPRRPKLPAWRCRQLTPNLRPEVLTVFFNIMLKRNRSRFFITCHTYIHTYLRTLLKCPSVTNWNALTWLVKIVSCGVK